MDSQLRRSIEQRRSRGWNCVGIILRSYYRISFRLDKQMTNNGAEYEALMYGLELALKLGVQNLKVFLDLELLLGHVSGVFEMKDKRMKAYCGKVTELVKHFWRIDSQVIKI